MIGFWRRRKTLAVHLVFWPIILVFVIWGFERYGNPIGGAAAVVNNRTITVSEYRQALQRMLDFYGQLFQGNLDEEAQKKYRIREAALQQLINSELIVQGAEGMGLRVTDSEVAARIVEIPAFKKEGQFSKDVYEGVLKANRLNPAQFEQSIRREELSGKIRKIFETTIVASEYQKSKEAELKRQKVNLEVMKIEPQALLAGIAVDGKRVDDFLKDASGAKQVKEYFDLNKGEFEKPEQVHAKHILLKATKGKTDEEAAAKQKVSQIQAELKGSSIEKLAAKYSDDPGSKTKGGDLGFFARGRMVPEFENAAFAAPIGKIEVVQSEFGFHILRVDAKLPAVKKSFEDVKLEIAKRILARKEVDTKLDTIEKLLATDPNKAVESLKLLDKSLKWEETGLFSLVDDAIPKLSSSEEVMAAVPSLTEAKPYYAGFVRSAESRSLVRLKKRETLAGQEAVDGKASKLGAPGAERGLSQGAFGLWVNGLTKAASIKENPLLFKTDISD